MRRHLPISLILGLSAVACGDDTAGGSGTGGAGGDGATTTAQAGPSSSSQSGSGSPTSGSGGEGPGATASTGEPGTGGDPGPGPGPGPGSGGNGGDGGEAPGAGGGGGGGDCTAITLDDLAYGQDGIYVSAVAPNLVDAGTDDANIRFTTAGVPQGDEPGVYDLADEPDVADCSRCVAVFADVSEEGFSKLFFQESGTLTLEAEGNDVLGGRATFSLDGVRLVESTLDGDLHSTPVPGGECLYLASAEFDDPVPADWECPASWYTDADCDCGCGAPDPTCKSSIDVNECDTCECEAPYQGFSCAGIVSSSDTSQCLPQFVIDTGLISTPFVDNSVACVPLTTGFPGTVAQIQAAVVSASHTFVGDLTYRLGPGAAAISFMDRPREPEIGNGTPADFAEGAPIVFTVDAVVGAESMGEGLGSSDVVCQTDGVCFFRPEPQSFDDLVGVAFVGQWYFCAIDSGVGDTGEIRRVQVYGTYE